MWARWKWPLLLLTSPTLLPISTLAQAYSSVDWTGWYKEYTNWKTYMITPSYCVAQNSTYYSNSDWYGNNIIRFDQNTRLLEYFYPELTLIFCTSSNYLGKSSKKHLYYFKTRCSLASGHKNIPYRLIKP
jgi:hypothetical protein